MANVRPLDVPVNHILCWRLLESRVHVYACITDVSITCRQQTYLQVGNFKRVIAGPTAHESFVYFRICSRMEGVVEEAS